MRESSCVIGAGSDDDGLQIIGPMDGERSFAPPRRAKARGPQASCVARRECRGQMRLIPLAHCAACFVLASSPAICALAESRHCRKGRPRPANADEKPNRLCPAKNKVKKFGIGIDVNRALGLFPNVCSRVAPGHALKLLCWDAG